MLWPTREDYFTCMSIHWTFVSDIMKFPQGVWDILRVDENGTHMRSGCAEGVISKPEIMNFLLISRKYVTASMWTKEFYTSGHVKNPS